MSHVCVFEWRYGSNEMRHLFSLENIVKTYILVEAALLHGLEAVGVAPKGCSDKVRECANRAREIAEEMYRLEKSRGHDIASLVELLSRECTSECAPLIHYGLTSNDVIDTAWAVLLRDALDILVGRVCRVLEKLERLARDYADAIMPGRTHGQYALPITFGFKIANYVYELSRSLERILEARERVVKGKLSGPVGTMAAWKGYGPAVEKHALEMLGLEPHPIATQVAPRDGFAELATSLAILASQLERLTLEVRELARPEIGEVWEEARRVGSSAMPHKRNPVVSERVAGLARLVRGLALGFLENIVLWHERDLSNSSFERHSIPHLLLAVDQLLLDTTWILDHLHVDIDAMRRHVEENAWLFASECLVRMLILKGIPRHEAHRLVWEAYMRAYEERAGKNLVIEMLGKWLDEHEIAECFDPRRQLGNYRELIDRALSYARNRVGGVCGWV